MPRLADFDEHRRSSEPVCRQKGKACLAPTTRIAMSITLPAIEELTRARASIQATQCDFALLSSLANVTYVTGTEVPVPVGAGAELTYGPWLALFSAKGANGWFVVPAGGAALARQRA